MSSRWARIEALVHEALSLPVPEREGFLDAACGSDAGLRQEVASLLAQQTAAGSFLETPATLIGRQLGPYRIDARIGAGGMGEVYRARDTKLGRDVAIKMLPETFARDADRFARFTREAQTLAALNHPNIAHIHGLEESSEVRALVMELVEGDDLSVLIARGPMPLAEAPAVAFDPAGALEFSKPRLLFEVPYVQQGGPGNMQYDVAPDGRFLMMKELAQGPPHFNIIQGWTARLLDALNGKSP